MNRQSTQMEKMATAFLSLYGGGKSATLLQMERYLALREGHAAHFGSKEVRFYSAPGRTEICGNHTDHNGGNVLAAAVNLDTVCAVSKNDDQIIRFYSQGYEPFLVDLHTLAPQKEEEGTSNAILRGVCSRFAQLGMNIGGFDAVASSSVLPGSGLSSSAAFEVLIATVLDGLYNNGSMDPLLKAQICQYAENRYFGKPCGLMDQTASAIGGLVAIDFGQETPNVEKLSYDFAEKRYSLVVVNTGTSHDDLTAHYASIPEEMKRVAAYFGKENLRQVEEDTFYAALADLRRQAGERAVLRAMHFYNENQRVQSIARELQSDHLSEFLRLIVQSGESSWMLLQNIFAPGTSQAMALALALSAHLLGEDGAWRVHGGGFAGTILAFVPENKMQTYLSTMNRVFADNACTVLSIRSAGACEVDFQEEI